MFIYKKFIVLAKKNHPRKSRRDFLVSENSSSRPRIFSGIHLCKNGTPRSWGIRSCKSRLLAPEGFAAAQGTFSSRNPHVQPAERGDGRERYLRAPPARLNYLSHIEQTQFPVVSFASANEISFKPHTLSPSRTQFSFSFTATAAGISHSFSFSLSLSFSLSPSLAL